jgi:hypothetical protein
VYGNVSLKEASFTESSPKAARNIFGEGAIEAEAAIRARSLCSGMQDNCVSRLYFVLFPKNRED